MSARRIRQLGTGAVDTTRYCERPLRAELRVTGIDVLLGAVTLLIYTPHTLYVTCPRAQRQAASSSGRNEHRAAAVARAADL